LVAFASPLDSTNFIPPTITIITDKIPTIQEISLITVDNKLVTDFLAFGSQPPMAWQAASFESFDISACAGADKTEKDIAKVKTNPTTNIAIVFMFE